MIRGILRKARLVADTILEVLEYESQLRELAPGVHFLMSLFVSYSGRVPCSQVPYSLALLLSTV